MVMYNLIITYLVYFLGEREGARLAPKPGGAPPCPGARSGAPQSLGPSTGSPNNFKKPILSTA